MSAALMASLPLGELTAMFYEARARVSVLEQFFSEELEDRMPEKWEIMDIMPEIYELHASLEKDGVFYSPDDEARLRDLKNQVAIKEEHIKKTIRAHPDYHEYRSAFKIALRLRDELHTRFDVDEPMWRKPMF